METHKFNVIMQWITFQTFSKFSIPNKVYLKFISAKVIIVSDRFLFLIVKGTDSEIVIYTLSTVRKKPVLIILF
jgi:hypothetical protein